MNPNMPEVVQVLISYRFCTLSVLFSTPSPCKFCIALSPNESHVAETGALRNAHTIDCSDSTRAWSQSRSCDRRVPSYRASLHDFDACVGVCDSNRATSSF